MSLLQLLYLRSVGCTAAAYVSVRPNSFCPYLTQVRFSVKHGINVCIRTTLTSKHFWFVATFWDHPQSFTIGEPRQGQLAGMGAAEWQGVRALSVANSEYSANLKVFKGCGRCPGKLKCSDLCPHGKLS